MSHYIGIDVSKTYLDIDWMGKHKRYGNKTSDINILIKQFISLQKRGLLKLVVCEATGGYEKKIVAVCRQASIPIHIAHANKVRYFAKSKGLLAKTDKLDARVLSEYGRLLTPEADAGLLNETAEEIKHFLKRREQLQADRKRELCRIDKIKNPKIKNSIKDHIKWLSKKIEKIEEELSSLQKSKDIKPQHELLTSIPAIGDLTACYLLAFLPELGKLSHKELGSLIGVVPYNHDSGFVQGKRYIQGGRAVLRRVLYMCAMTAVRYHPDLKVFYSRLIAKGKIAKVALIAVIRKLICMANSVMTRGSVWQEKLIHI